MQEQTKNCFGTKFNTLLSELEDPLEMIRSQVTNVEDKVGDHVPGLFPELEVLENSKHVVDLQFWKKVRGQVEPVRMLMKKFEMVRGGLKNIKDLFQVLNINIAHTTFVDGLEKSKVYFCVLKVNNEEIAAPKKSCVGACSSEKVVVRPRRTYPAST